MPLFRALAKNMAPMTNADESPYAFLTEHLSFYSIYSLMGRPVRKAGRTYFLALLTNGIASF